MWLLVLFIAVPLIEIALFIEVGGWLTLWPTLAIVVATAVAGSVLVRAQGRHVLADLRRSLDEMRDPTAPLAHGALLLLAGALLLTPGFLTDTIGLALLVPRVRVAAMRLIAQYVVVARFGPPGGGRGAPPAREDVVEGAFEELPPRRDDSPPSGWTHR